MKPFFSDFFDVEHFFDKSSLDSMPAVNIAETDNEYSVEVAAPGYKKEDFKVRVENDMLNISAEVKSESLEEKKNYTRKEYGYHSFKRSFTMPDNVKDDQISARFENGILYLSLPKSGTSVQSNKEINIA